MFSISKGKVFWIAVLTLCVMVFLFGVERSYHNNVILNERFSDVRNLFGAYRNLPNATNIVELIAFLERKGVKLKNPIAKDPLKPCYRLVSTGPGADEDPAVVLIEETNVTDDRLIVVAFSDGSTSLENRTNANGGQ